MNSKTTNKVVDCMQNTRKKLQERKLRPNLHITVRARLTLSQQPNSLPSSLPSSQPSRQPSQQPSSQPSVQLTDQPNLSVKSDFLHFFIFTCYIRTTRGYSYYVYLYYRFGAFHHFSMWTRLEMACGLLLLDFHPEFQRILYMM